MTNLVHQATPSPKIDKTSTNDINLMTAAPVSSNSHNNNETIKIYDDYVDKFYYEIEE